MWEIRKRIENNLLKDVCSNKEGSNEMVLMQLKKDKGRIYLVKGSSWNDHVGDVGLVAAGGLEESSDCPTLTPIDYHLEVKQVNDPISRVVFQREKSSRGHDPDSVTITGHVSDPTSQVEVLKCISNPTTSNNLVVDDSNKSILEGVANSNQGELITTIDSTQPEPNVEIEVVVDENITKGWLQKVSKPKNGPRRPRKNGNSLSITKIVQPLKIKRKKITFIIQSSTAKRSEVDDKLPKCFDQLKSNLQDTPMNDEDES